MIRADEAQKPPTSGRLGSRVPVSACAGVSWRSISAPGARARFRAILVCAAVARAHMRHLLVDVLLILHLDVARAVGCRSRTINPLSFDRHDQQVRLPSRGRLWGSHAPLPEWCSTCSYLYCCAGDSMQSIKMLIAVLFNAHARPIAGDACSQNKDSSQGKAQISRKEGGRTKEHG